MLLLPETPMASLSIIQPLLGQAIEHSPCCWWKGWQGREGGEKGSGERRRVLVEGRRLSSLHLNFLS